MKKKIVLGWSGGKDSCLTLYELRQAGHHEIVALLTMVTEGYDRISMHGVRRTLLQQQAESIGLPLHEVWLPMNCTDEIYQTRMLDALVPYQRDGIDTFAFGDLFLEDVRRYRIERLARVGMKALFPIWKRDSREMVRTFSRLGFKAILTCVDTEVLDSSCAGQLIDESFLQRYPSNLDPCGENGEFHSFVFDGPLFRTPVAFTRGEVVMRDHFCYCDLVPAYAAAETAAAAKLSRFFYET